MKPLATYLEALKPVLIKICQSGNPKISGVTNDSRQVGRNSLFVAVPGSNCDGHDFIDVAIAAGANTIIHSLEDLEIRERINYLQVTDSYRAYALAVECQVDFPAENLDLIGITGTNGKTTTSFLVAGILATAGYQTGLLGTLGCFDGQQWHDSSLTTPPADELAAALAGMLRGGCTHAVIEVSSHALDQGRIAGVDLDAACVTNVRRDHLDYHRSIDDYRLTKSRLLDHLIGQGVAVLNADDPTSAGYLHRIDNPVLTVAVRSAAEVTGRLIDRGTSEQTFLLTAGSETMPVRTKMIGTHHVYNCLMATAVGLAYGIDLATVVRGLEVIGHVPGRLERIECGQPFSVFVDYAHTPDALTASLETLREVVSGRLICVFGAGGDRDPQKRPLMARAVEAEADVAVVTTDNPRTEDPATIEQDVLSGFHSRDSVKAISDRQEAIAWALANAEPGDCVLIAGKGHETYQIIGQQRFAFDDRQIARQWLHQMQPEGIPLGGDSRAA